MRTLKKIVVGIIILSFPVWMLACASAPWADIRSKDGDIVQLFDGGGNMAKEDFCVNEIVSVYRYVGKRFQRYTKVGKVKITGFKGDNYLEGIAIEGNIKNNDVAFKPNSKCNML